MRHEFYEPISDDQASAVLILGTNRVDCYIVDFTDDEFVVAVPDVDHYEGDPKLILLTREAAVPVRLVLQEAHAGGYSYRLRRTNEALPTYSEYLRKLFSKFSAKQYCAAAMVAATLLCVVCIPGTNDQSQLSSDDGPRQGMFGWLSPSVRGKSQASRRSSNDNRLASADKEKQKNRKPKRPELGSDVQTVSVSMVSAASISKPEPELLSADEMTIANQNLNLAGSQSNKAKKRAATLASLLEEGQVGRLLSVNKSVIPWLFGSAPSDAFFSVRMSDAAWNDLQRFEEGLRGLPSDISKDAISSLRRTLQLASNVNNARTVRGTDDVFVIQSDDANVYFRTFNGLVEIVRVLPIEMN